jgi:NNP family nitrate/nitrite transporter-like MFS transporter
MELWSLRFCLWFVGLAGGFYLPSAISTLTDTVPVRHWGKAIAIHELAPTLGFILTPLVSEVVIHWFSWRSVFLFFGLFALLQALIFRRFGRGGFFTGEPPNTGTLCVLFKMPSYWLMIILFSLGVSGTLGTFTMLPLYLVTEHAMERSWANTLISLSRISSVGMALVGGWFSDRFGTRQTIITVLLVTGALTVLLGSASRSWITIIVFLQPLTAVCFFPAGFAALSQITSPEIRHIAVALTTSFALLVGGGLIPTFIGFVGDVHSFVLGIALLGGFIMTGAVFAPFLRFQSAPEDTSMPYDP